MKTLRVMVLSIAAISQAAIGGVICSGDSVSIAIDSRVGTEPMLDSVVLPWNASWIGGNAGATVVITDNGEEVKRATDSGDFVLTIVGGERHELAYITYIDSMAQEEVYTATVYAKWKYDVQDGGAVIVATTQTSGNVMIPPEIDGYRVTSIGDFAFSGCSNLTSITIPNSVRHIGSRAFEGCSGLTSLTITDGVTSIGDEAFSGCSGLRSVTIPESVEYIGKMAFNGCNGIVSATVPASLSVGWKCGLNQVKINIYADASTSVSGLDAYDVVSGVLMGYAFDKKTASKTFSDPIYGGSYKWNTSATTFGYCGHMYMEKGSTYVFGKYFDDAASVKVEGLEVLLNSDHKSFATGVYTPDRSGWHEVEIWVADGGSGDKGPKGGGTDANAQFWDATMGLGWRDDGVTNAQPQSDWHKLMDTGDGSLFRVYGTLVMRDLFPSSHDKLANVNLLGEPTEIPDSAFAGCASLTSIAIPSSVTKIGDYAFCGCSALTNLTIPNSVAHIGSHAFEGCSGLMSIEIPSSVTSIGASAFSGCSGLSSVEIPDNVTSIGEGCFSKCVNLVDITLPFLGTQRGVSGRSALFGFIFGSTSCDGCEATTQYYATSSYAVFYMPISLRRVVIADESVISFGAFYGCRHLTDIEINGSATYIGRRVFYGCIGLLSLEIPESVRSINEFAFYGCSALTGFSIPDGVTSIGGSAFYNCSGMKSLIIPDHVISIGDDAFNGCSGLTSILIPNSVATIGNKAFVGCKGLASIAIPDSVTSIGERAFAKCANLESLTLPFIGSARGVETGVGSVFGYVFGTESFQGGTNAVFVYRTGNAMETATLSRYLPASLKSVVVTDESIVAYGAFEQCSCLTNIVLNDGVTSIGDYAFDGCVELSGITIPSSVNSVGEYSFVGCESLPYGEDGFRIVGGWVWGYNDPYVVSLEIPDGVIGIGSGAFANFWDLEEVVFPDSLQYIGGGAFDTCTGLDGVVIPDGVETIGSGAFRNCTYLRDITIGEGVEAIGDEAFANCTQLSTLTIPDNVAEIGDAAFSNCWRMLSARLPLGLESAGVRMFDGCSSLSGVTAPTHAFTMERLFGERHTQITSVSISSGETEVCADGFAGCAALASVAMPNAVTNIGNSAFANCTSLAALELSDALESIGAQAFSGCSALAAIVLPDDVAEIGARIFEGCTSLANVTLSRALAGIPDYAFNGCSRLSSVVVPASVTSLGAYIGNYLSSVYCLGNAPSCDANVYASRSRAVTTYVVQGSRGWDGIASSRDLPTEWNGYPITFWEPNRLNATFDANGGVFFDGATAYACEQITDTGYALPPYEPTLEGYLFDGWWTDPYEGAQIKASVRVNETRDITFYAHWKGAPSAITVRFNPNGGTVSPDERQYYSTLTYETLPVPTREHYKFAGWWTKIAGGNKITVSSRVPTADQELFAHWTPETYVVRYNANGGVGAMPDQAFLYGAPVILRSNVFSMEDKSFVGWAVEPGGSVVYADGATLGSIAAIQDGVVNLYAVWRGDSYSIRFDSNGGVGAMDNATFEMKEQRALPSCSFTRDGFDFAGWATSPSGDVVYGDMAEVSELTDEVNGTVVLYAVWQAFTVAAPVVTPGNGAVFVGDSCEVSISCATAGADIYYSTNGKAPKLTPSNLYAGAFAITDTTTIYAVAKKGDATAYVVVTISKQALTLGYVLGAGGSIGVSTSAEFPWEPVADGNTDLGYSAKSALPTEDDMDSWVELSVVGAGVVSFKCRTSCEWDYTGSCEFDCLMVHTDGVEVVDMRMDGIQTQWTDRSVTFVGEGEHKLRLTYHKDESDFDGDDCAWVSDVVWTPAGGSADVVVDVGGGKTVTVPATWLSEKTERAATDAAANGRKVWECYVVGLDPEDATNDFRIVSFPIGADGTPDISAITFDPPEAKWNVQGATPVLKGKATLEGTGEWQTVTDENKAEMRFFRVEVEMP